MAPIGARHAPPQALLSRQQVRAGPRLPRRTRAPRPQGAREALGQMDGVHERKWRSQNVSTGKKIRPKGSMWRMGLSVRRPARLAVSSPKRRATAPCDTSWRMTDGTIAIRKSRVFLLRCIRNGGSAVFRRAVDAVARRRHGLETGLGD